MKRVWLLLPLAVGCARQLKVAPVEGAARTAVEVVRGGPTSAQTRELELEQALSGAVLHFDFDEATLSQQDRLTLQRVAEALRARPWASVRVNGHCDERGTQEYNLALGQRRAEVARAYLIALGVEPAIVESVSFGAEMPAADGHDEEAWARNRRAELEPQGKPLAER